nr:MAG TPA: hypothetical protein [Caudoviricetes sp.]
MLYAIVVCNFTLFVCFFLCCFKQIINKLKILVTIV